MDDLNQDGRTQFDFPFWTIEGMAILGRDRLAVANDNNYPFGQAREYPNGGPENTELIVLKVEPLW